MRTLQRIILLISFLSGCCFAVYILLIVKDPTLKTLNANDDSFHQFPRNAPGLDDKISANPETKERFMRRIGTRMKERKSILEAACQSQEIKDEDKVEDIRIVLSEKYKLAYCYIPKAGCTNMKLMIMQLNGFDNITQKHVHRGSIKSYFYHGTRMPDIVEKRKFIKFLLVRHPYERLVSSFVNKVAQTTNEVFFQRSQEMRKTYGTPARTKDQGQPANFKEFIDFISDQTRLPVANGVDAHWNTHNSICRPCSIHYDVIAHLETIDEDAKYLLHLIDAPSEITYNGGYSKNGKSRTSHKNLVESYFDQLENYQKEKLFAAVKQDFMLFNYSVT